MTDHILRNLALACDAIAGATDEAEHANADTRRAMLGHSRDLAARLHELRAELERLGVVADEEPTVAAPVVAAGDVLAFPGVADV